MMALKLSKILNCHANLSRNHNFNILFFFYVQGKPLNFSMENFKMTNLHVYVYILSKFKQKKV